MVEASTSLKCRLCIRCHGLVPSCDFSVDHGDDEDELAEILFDSDSGSNGVAEPITKSQPCSNQSQFQSQSSEHVGHY